MTPVTVCEHKLFDKKDIILIIVLLCVATGSFIYFSRGGNEVLYGEIFCDGVLVECTPLNEERDIKLKDGKVVIHIQKGGISFVSSDCKDKLCVNCGVLKKSGQSAVCIPENTVITVKGGDGVDIVSY